MEQTLLVNFSTFFIKQGGGGRRERERQKFLKRNITVVVATVQKVTFCMLIKAETNARDIKHDSLLFRFRPSPIDVPKSTLTPLHWWCYTGGGLHSVLFHLSPFHSKDSWENFAKAEWRDFLMRFYAKSEKFTDVKLQWIRFQLVWKVSWIQDVFLMIVVKNIFWMGALFLLKPFRCKKGFTKDFGVKKCFYNIRIDGLKSEIFYSQSQCDVVKRKKNYIYNFFF